MIAKRILLPTLGVLFGLVAHATNYYVSENGNDNSSGTSPGNAWRTLSKVNSYMWNLNPGDSVLFERGGTFVGSLSIQRSGNANDPLVFGAYGSGPLPIISGSEQVSGWSNYSGNIYQATVNADVEHLFYNDKPMALARFPNSGWLRNEQGSGTHIYDADLTQPNGYWNGAELVIRGTMWSYDLATVNSYSNNTLNFNNIYYNLSNLDWGYFIRGKFEELDAPGEWYYDSSNNQLYHYPSNGSNPNGQNIRAGVHERGFTVEWQQHHVIIQNLQFMHQTQYGVRLDGAHHVDIVSCVFTENYMGVSSYGNDNRYLNNQFIKTMATAIYIDDDNSAISYNQFEQIAMQPGLGESNWGYFGIRTQGDGNEISYNRLNTIGYIGIDAKSDALIRRNYVNNANALLNDGGGIACDNTDGMVIQENIVLNISGDLESAATEHLNYHTISHGIYFGNSGIRNTTVERNTVANCTGTGIHVDHTMDSEGNSILDNVVYNNANQIRFSDFSNYNGAGATYPYFVPAYNTQVSGNTFCSLERDQASMIWLQVHTAQHTDFGSFDNNIYYNPFNEQSIKVVDNFNGNLEHRYTLGKWQQDYQRDHNSTSSPFWMDGYTISDYLSGELITNGNFNDGLNNWSWWPGDGSITTDNTLDGNTMDVQFNTNNTYYEIKLNHNNNVNVQNGDYYLLEYSVLGQGHGEFEPIFKLNSTSWSSQPMLRRFMPIDGDRKDRAFVFQAEGSGNGKVYFNQHYTEPNMWVDNVSLHKVSAQPIDATQILALHYNDSESSTSIPLSGCWEKLDGTPVSGSITLAPFSSVVLRKLEGQGCSQAGGYEFGIKVLLAGNYNAGSGMMEDDLRDAQLLPINEPYTALGFQQVGNGGDESTTAGVLNVTGPNAIVDWVYVELRDASNPAIVIECRNALLQRDGDIVDMDGVSPVFFQTGSGSAYVAVKHRNHLGIMTAAPLTFSSGVTQIDLTSMGTALYGQNATVTSADNKRLMWSGDISGDGVIKYIGSNNDRDLILTAIGGTVPTATVSGYITADVSLDGEVKYTGNNNDRDQVLESIGGSIPTLVVQEQLP